MGRVSVEDSVREAGGLLAPGVRAVLLFGIPEDKDEEGSGAYDEDGIVQLALRALRERSRSCSLLTDVCLCEYTVARPLRRDPRRRGLERRDARAARAHGGQPRRGRRGRRRARAT